ncbi:MAG: polyribonucleotide nucleotidyltransferase [Lentisphaerae bacterium]|jgi:polyribonucleotide nucleotidyltransferase|nr:polyribonucleotide nucleotidyltransferase [Lentisphaerota bacterium]MBT4821396.1 polyribonucleotide nucleotidyltransferase [Lentisphaerota bacterium]MBT5608073.1 polyribonucleotide nucleotidyltransferase [Lentisphaerota bacterium]MBT7057593.1 polyribonucleotide nucleotidyltransferase [Lentisphaerota bacterium]MBT7840220.1 polyribonucleotide nucleotidyltransferase [Lentisphaerota bacterium]
MSIERVTIEVGPERTVTIETGKMALLAGGSVTVQQGDTIVLVTACSAKPRPGLDFFPLQVDYREKFSAAGMFPGGYFKREGRPTEKEILTARMTDRPLRALFPKGFIDDVQIMAGLLSADGENEADVLSMVGASAALMLSDMPFQGPIGAIRVGCVDGEFIANPTHSELENSVLDLVYAGVEGKTIMIEGSADEINEELLRDALTFADGIVTKQIAAQRELTAKSGKAKAEPRLTLVPDAVTNAVREFCAGKLDDACLVPEKAERYAALDAVLAQVVEALTPQFDNEGDAPDFKAAFEDITEETVRRLILEGKRMDGRAMDQVRPLMTEVGLLPRAHGSALFGRGETQAIVSVTLGPAGEAQEYDVITGGKGKKPFFLHYNFPNFSVGETGRIMGPGRREIGHGALAERSVAGVVPKDYPYTVRAVSDILGSNGSSSMASVCGTSMALMDAGVPLSNPVAGISVGLVTGDDGRRVFLTDILGAEDHYGDMDFKLSSTSKGITGFQLDLKIAGLDIPGMYEAMLQNKRARMEILDQMNQCIDKPREELSEFAPKIETLHINPERIGALIGPGGKIIKGIVEMSGAKIDVQDDGTINIFASNGESMEIAFREVQAIAAEPEIGKIYEGVVRTVKDFGAFVEIMPGHDGLLHISELADYRVQNVEEICKLGDTVSVKVIDIDDRGRIRLSRRAALKEMGE